MESLTPPAWKNSFFNLNMVESPAALWAQVTAHLAQSLSQGVFRTWVAPSQLQEVNFQDDHLVCVIEAPTNFHITFLEKNLKTSLEKSLTEFTQVPVHVVFRVGQLTTTPIVKDTKKKELEPTSLADIQNVKEVPKEHFSPTVESLFSQHSMAQAEVDYTEHKIKQAGLNRQYTFENFAVSSTNEMAHAAAVAVSQSPGKAYNVLYLYGGVGVGKTHLMQAVGQNILKENPETTLLYRTGEEFMNEIVEAIQTKKTIQMKQRYRSVNVLLIDDIQFMAGKRSMQEEFFHTFNAVIKARGQVLLTSDRPPHEIHPLDDRIQSRLESGLIIDIQQPSFELRTAIVLIKAKHFQIQIPMDVAQAIASKVTSTRRLEGVVKAVHSEVMFRKKAISIELVELLLKQQKGQEPESLKIYAKPLDIIKTIANHYHIKLMDIKGPRREKSIAMARHISMYLLKQELNLPLLEIGRYFGNRDHTSVLHAVRKIETLLDRDDQLETQIQAIKTSLSSGVSQAQYTQEL